MSATFFNTLKTLAAMGFTTSDCATLMHKERGVAARTYRCALGYCCVEITTPAADGVVYSWEAPVVWDGERAAWDAACPSHEFHEMLEAHYPLQA